MCGSASASSHLFILQFPTLLVSLFLIDIDVEMGTANLFIPFLDCHSLERLFPCPCDFRGEKFGIDLDGLLTSQ